ncbi:siroheme synthase CysG [Halodurantibacterium flavum]|uniref:Siroheme synthase CysG n=1 Tax=Halodurantibacterium flavum TaxID=1382802 RepID=A0ABW4S9Y2_9RHOB
MKTFPMFLRMDGRRVVFAGGSEEIARKIRLIRRTEAAILICTPDPLVPELAVLVAAGDAVHHPRWPDARDLAGAALLFVATGDDATDVELAQLARRVGVPVNVVDRPDLCDAYTPCIVDRDPVVVAIGTEGTAPVLARQIRAGIEATLEPGLGRLAALAGRMRGMVEDHVPKHRRRAFWEWAFAGRPRHLQAKGDGAGAAITLRDAALSGGAPDRDGGWIALVGAGPGARDLLTLRAMQRLQQADVIFYDRLVDPEVLDLARRDADRVFVGKEVGAHSWPQDQINATIVAAAWRGLRVVRLKSGDPSVFGRACEEIEAARAAGIAVELVPGITAASAAAASLTRALTERQATERLVVATATCKPGDRADLGAAFAPGTTLALYMAMHRLAEVEAELIAAGAPRHCEVEFVQQAGSAGERILRSTLGRMAADAAVAGLRNPAVILVRWPKEGMVELAGDLPRLRDRPLAVGGTR